MTLLLYIYLLQYRLHLSEITNTDTRDNDDMIEPITNLVIGTRTVL